MRRERRPDRRSETNNKTRRLGLSQVSGRAGRHHDPGCFGHTRTTTPTQDRRLLAVRADLGVPPVRLPGEDHAVLVFGELHYAAEVREALPSGGNVARYIDCHACAGRVDEN